MLLLLLLHHATSVHYLVSAQGMAQERLVGYFIVQRPAHDDAMG